MGVLEAMVKKFLYFPAKLAQDAALPPQAEGAQEVVGISSTGDSIHGLYWPAPDGRPTILFLHGNAETVFSWSFIREDFEPLECGLLLIDYPGYGKSSGQPNEQGLYAAGRAALDMLAEREVPLERTVFFGKSLGGGVATLLATDHQPLGLVLESTFRSIPKVIRRYVPVVPLDTFLARERYDNESRMAEIEAPVLIIHGTLDTLVPASEGRALYDAATSPKNLYLVEGADHNDVASVAGPGYGERLRRWVDAL